MSQALITINFREGLARDKALQFTRSLTEKISEQEDLVTHARLRLPGESNVPPAKHFPETERERLADDALGPWNQRRVHSASTEIEALATALLASEKDLRTARKAMDGYDRAECAIAVDRDRLAERLRLQLAVAINSEARLILSEIEDDFGPESDGWAAALTVVCGVLAGAHTETVALAARLAPATVAPLAERLRSNGIWEDGRTLIDADIEDGEELAVWVWLASLVADGELVYFPEGFAVPHLGRAGAYNRGCRCDECREAKRKYQLGYRAARRKNA